MYHQAKMPQSSRCAVLLFLLLCDRVRSFVPTSISASATNIYSAVLSTSAATPTTTTRLFSGMMGGGNGYNNNQRYVTSHIIIYQHISYIIISSYISRIVVHFRILSQHIHYFWNPLDFDFIQLLRWPYIFDLLVLDYQNRILICLHEWWCHPTDADETFSSLSSHTFPSSTGEKKL